MVSELQRNVTDWEQRMWDAHARRLAALGPRVYRLLPSGGPAPFLNWDIFWERLRLGNESFAPALLHMASGAPTFPPVCSLHAVASPPTGSPPVLLYVSAGAGG